jgi:hypothetical protein
MERKRQDDFRPSCFVRTVDGISLVEARYSSNFPRLKYIIAAFLFQKKRRIADDPGAISPEVWMVHFEVEFTDILGRW